MKLSVGIVGLPNVGKSTLFKALTKNPVDISNYPFCTIEPNVGVVEVPDFRLEKLVNIFHSEKIVPAPIEFIDIAGLVKGANKGEGLGNQFLSHIREVDLILHIVRCFKAENVVHVEGKVDSLRDIRTVNSELILKDIETVQKRLSKIKKEARGDNKEAKKEVEVLEKLEGILDQGKLISIFLKEFSEDERKILDSLFLLSAKKQVYLLNSDQMEIPPELSSAIGDSQKLVLNLREELELSELSKEEREEIGVKETKLDELIKICYNTLNLITFFTLNEKETRAWPIEKGTVVQKAAGEVHTDFETKFIKAEVINWQELVENGSWAKSLEKGKIRSEGKEYIVQDGDVIKIRI